MDKIFHANADQSFFKGKNISEEGDYSSMELVEVEGGVGEDHILLTEEEFNRLTRGEGSGVIQEHIQHPTTSVRPIQKDRSEGDFAGDSGEENYEMIQLLDDPLVVGATTTAAAGGEEVIHMIEPIPQGMKMRRNRVFGTCRCPECGQTFVNTARLERHLAVHQVFGSYLCPLCGKTYKYEYNLFYHWRRTCRDLNELMNVDDRKAMDVNALRQLVDEVAAKKAELGTLEPPFRHPPQLQETPPQRSEIPVGRRGEACPECGVVVLASHLDRHMAVHRGEVAVDTRGVSGGFYCDLCGLMFRQSFNLLKHWRTNCPEIQMQIPKMQLSPDMELTMDDETLKHLVEELLQKKRSEEAGVIEEPPPRLSKQAQDIADQSSELNTNEGLKADIRQLTSSDTKVTEVISGDHLERKGDSGEGEICSQELQPSPLKNTRSRFVKGLDFRVRMGSKLRVGEEGVKGDEGEQEVDVTTIEERAAALERRELEMGAADLELARQEEETLGEEEWGEHFADETYDEEQMGRLPPVDESDIMGPLGFPTSAGGRAKWSMAGGPVQCPECFRSFANAGRLERHLAGFHASYGTHHCSLCGNRFKYDYNLLYHYRRSCPYTKAFIDRDVREQMDAPSLRKLVRNLAQKEVRLTPHVEPPPRLAGRDPPKPRLAMRYPSNQPPAHLLMPRPGLPEGKTCPVCGIIFYGVGAIQRHMQAAHPNEWEEWVADGGPEMRGVAEFDEEEEMEELEAAANQVGKGVVTVEETPPVLQKVELSDAAKKKARDKDESEIDPTLESSIATFLTEMRQEATGQQNEEHEPVTSKQSAPLLKKPIIAERRKGTLVRGSSSQSHNVMSADFEEDLDVDGAEGEERRRILESKSKNLHFSAKGSPRRESPTKKPNARTPVEEPICSICNKSFLLPAHLMQHMKRFHGGKEAPEPSVCVLCNMKFPEKYNLITHWRSSCIPLKAAIKDKTILRGLDSDGLEQLAVEIANGAEVVEDVIETAEPIQIHAEPDPEPEPMRKRLRKSTRGLVEEDVD